MDWLMDNAIANMYGPKFLLLYGVVVVLTLGVCWMMLSIRTEPFPSRSVTSKTDNYGDADTFGWPVRLAGAAVIVGLGGYKLAVALAKGRHNVGFLIMMGLVALCILFAIRPTAFSGKGD